jgi:hypothetical protein
MPGVQARTPVVRVPRFVWLSGNKPIILNGYVLRRHGQLLRPRRA